MSTTPTGIELTAKIFPLAFFTLLFKPTIEIDGQPIRGAWSTQFIPASPGTHTVVVFFKYLFIMNANRGSIQVTVAEGQPVRLLYKARWLVFLPGKLTIAP
jgi:hypothetical protein